MMQAADFGNLHDADRLGGFDRSDIRCILVQRNVGSCTVVVGEGAGQDAAEVAFAQNKDMVQTLPRDRADEALRERVLPRAEGRREDFTDPHALGASPKRVPVDAVAIAEKVGRRGVVWEDVDELLGGPGGGGMLSDIEVHDAPARWARMMRTNSTRKRGGHREEIQGDEASKVIGQERAPGL